MKIANIVKGGLMVAVISLLYNLVIFSLLDYFPQFSFGFDELSFFGFGFYVVLFLKDMFVGFILIILFSLAYQNITNDNGDAGFTAKAIFFFVLYAIFALLSFTLGDLLLMETPEGMLLLLTVDGFVEAFLATIPVRIFAVER